MRGHVCWGERFDLDQTATNAIYRVPFPTNNSFAATPWRGVVDAIQSDVFWSALDSGTTRGMTMYALGLPWRWLCVTDCTSLFIACGVQLECGTTSTSEPGIWASMPCLMVFSWASTVFISSSA